MSETKQADVWVYDIETWPNFFLVGVARPDDKDVRLLEVSEDRDDREELFQMFNQASRFFVGYNNHYFDNVVMNYILYYQPLLAKSDVAEFTQLVHEMGQQIIQDVYPRHLKYKGFFQSFDLMRIGNIQKSLKMVAINLRWPLVQDLPFSPFQALPVDDFGLARGYNVNDVRITQELFRSMREDINLRAKISFAYKVNVMDEPDSGMANRLLEKLYSDSTGLPVEAFIDGRTPRGEIPLSSVILPQVRFQTPKMQRWLEDIRAGVIKTSGEKLGYRVKIGNGVYDVGVGGLHSNNPSDIFMSSGECLLIDADVGSYYPTIMTGYSLKPEHLADSFLDLLKSLTERRLKAKREGDKVAAAALKIVVNSIFGKTGFEHHWLYDPLCMYRVTLNGQLFLLMLIEALEEEGIEVFYANTDGISAKVRPDQKDVYEAICHFWEDYTGFSLEFSEFETAVIRDVNNYLVTKKGGGVKMKGVLDTERWRDFQKGFDKPIVPLAIRAFFIDGIPPEEFIPNHTDILDFCMAQNAGGQFHIVYDEIDEATQKIVRRPMQKANRYYVSTTGGSLIKVSASKEISLVAGESVTVLNSLSDDLQRPIKYVWYIREAQKIIQLFQSKQVELF